DIIVEVSSMRAIERPPERSMTSPDESTTALCPAKQGDSMAARAAAGVKRVRRLLLASAWLPFVLAACQTQAPGPTDNNNPPADPADSNSGVSGSQQPPATPSGDNTTLEQLLLERMNRARLRPAAEAARFNIDLNEGLPAGTISTASKQPLAFNPIL